MLLSKLAYDVSYKYHAFKCTVAVSGDRTLINIMGTLLERYGKSEDQSGAPTDVTSLFPGLPCVAQFAEDGMWYRASVIKILEKDKVEVGNKRPPCFALCKKCASICIQE